MSLDKGVPQGSCLDPLLFNIYFAPLTKIVRAFGFEIIIYADYTQLVIYFEKDLAKTKQSFLDRWHQLAHGLQKKFSSWMQKKRLFGKAHQLWTVNWCPSELGIVPTPKRVVKNLGVRLDQPLTMKEQVMSTSGSCFHIRHLLRRAFLFLPLIARKMAVQALVVSHLDYCNVCFAN